MSLDAVGLNSAIDFGHIASPHYMTPHAALCIKHQSVSFIAFDI